MPGVASGASTTSGETGASTDSGRTRDLTVATNADDETTVVTTEMDFAGNPEHVTRALETMAWWDRDENGQSTGNSVEQLKAKWGSDMGANLAHFEAFSLAHPEVHEVLTASGFSNHPAIVEAGAILGRKYATVAGNPGEITTRKGKQTMDNVQTNDIEARIDEYTVHIDIARARGDPGRANRLFLEQQDLYRLLPGGTAPAVGSSGGRTA